MIMKWWRKRQRAMDMQILWPVCKDSASDIDHAKAAFMFHCMNDTAWTRDYSEAQLVHLIGDLQ